MTNAGNDKEQLEVHLSDSAINDLVDHFENSKAPDAFLKLAEKLQRDLDERNDLRKVEYEFENQSVKNLR